MNRPSTTHLTRLRRSRVIIDLDAIRHNYHYLKSIAPDSRVIAVIKADAYGHGAEQVAKALPNADAFAVATVMEAISLREAGIDQKMLVLGGVMDLPEMQQCVDFGLDPVIHQQWQIELLQQVERHQLIDVWLKFNSGMGRLGFPAEEFRQAVKRVRQIDSLGVIRLMTHLSDADAMDDDKTRNQIEHVNHLDLGHFEWGIANSAGLMHWPSSRVNWARAGIALYGSNPMIKPGFAQRLKPAMTFKTSVLAVNHLTQGESIGYGSLYTCSQDQVIAVVAAGYADGYPRHMQGGFVTIEGQSVPIVGRVSMDMVTVDVTGLNIQPGQEVVLWGDEPLAEDVARYSETISYELFCNAGCHAVREYRNA
jgi:alanine racemase